ncbi:MAG: heme-dependent oxidative N-demethylase subunit alpha family protein [Polaromonas sp.]
MDFDFSQIAVPFRMQPGLRRVSADGPHLTPLVAGSGMHAEKLNVLQLQQSRHAIPGFDAAPALAAIAAHARFPWPSQSLELAFEEDFAVLDGATGTIPWLCVSLPSHWVPEDKAGLSLAEIHAPVADNAALLAATSGLVKLVTQGGYWERYVWTLTPSARYDQHPGRHPRTTWPDIEDLNAFASQCHLRVERQAFLPVIDVHGEPLPQAVFTIRVMLEPLNKAVRTGADALRLHDALASMSPAVLDYKNLGPARARLLPWLAQRASETSPGQ